MSYNIAIDIDGVCSKTRPYFSNIISEEYNVDISKEQLYKRYIDLNGDRAYGDLVEKIVTENAEAYYSVPKISGSSFATQTFLYNHNHHITLLSSRFSKAWLNTDIRNSIYDWTKKWLKKNQIAYDDIPYPTPEYKYKWENIDSIDVFIDDKPSVLKRVKHNTENVYVILFNRPHNISIDIPQYLQIDSTYATMSRKEYAQNPRKQWEDIVTFVSEKSFK